MGGKCLALVFIFTVLYHIPTASIFRNYNISKYTVQLQQVNKAYDYSDFVLQWKISACMMPKKTCKAGRAKQAFGIHGLWPEKLRGEKAEPVTECKNKPRFDPKEIRRIHKDLESLWPSLYDDTYDKFSEREWQIHGTCFEDDGSPETAVFDYFHKTVSRAKAYNVLDYLTQAGIKLGVAYDVSVITHAIKAGLKTEKDVVQIQCLSLKKKWVVYQIFLCFNKRATALTPCPPKREMCSGKPMFPSSVDEGMESSIPMLERI